MANKRAIDCINKDDLIVIGGAGGFIAGAVGVTVLQSRDYTIKRALDDQL